MTVGFLLAAALALRVIDGDTIVLGAEHVRILDLDAAEIAGAECPAERALGLLAKSRLEALLRNEPIVVERRGLDRYGRTLALVRAGGKDVGARMIEEGYARRWSGARRRWCGGR